MPSPPAASLVIFAACSKLQKRSLMSNCDEHRFTGSTFNRGRSNQTHVKRIIFFLSNLWLQRRPFIGDQNVALPRTIGNSDRSSETHYLGVILRYAREVFLAICVSLDGLAFHDETGRGSIHTCLS